MPSCSVVPIEHVASPVIEPTDESRGRIESRVVLPPAYRRGLDALDGTPVLDFRPYFPQYDRVKKAPALEWVDRMMEGYFE